MQPEQLARLVGVNVRRRREELRLTQSDVARAADVNQTYLSDIENGKRSPNLSTVARLADALDVQPADLLSAVVIAAA